MLLLLPINYKWSSGITSIVVTIQEMTFYWQILVILKHKVVNRQDINYLPLIDDLINSIKWTDSNPLN